MYVMSLESLMALLNGLSMYFGFIMNICPKQWIRTNIYSMCLILKMQLSNKKEDFQVHTDVSETYNRKCEISYVSVFKLSEFLK